MKIAALAFKGVEKTDIDKSLYSDSNLELIGYYRVEPASRGEEKQTTIKLGKDEILEFEFEDGTNWISGTDNIDDLFPEIAFSAKRSTDNAVELPFEIETENADRSVVGKILLKGIKIFSKKMVTQEASKLASKLEDKQLEEKVGLFGLSSDFKLVNFTPDNSNKPYLLLIHGTASSFEGSFGEAKGTDFMNFARDKYDGRILAFQHRTLTESPLQNVKKLVEALPKNCILHLVTTSRGGLVGEVLSRFCNSSGVKGGFNSTELDILKKGYKKYYNEIEKSINDINSILSGKNIKVEKFVRIACPAGGTTLASNRLDFFLNITFNLIGLGAGIAASPVYMAFRSLTAAVIESKNKPETLPGLEAQRPGSPFIKALNCPVDIDNPDGRIVIDNSLVVIAGNSKPALKLSALWVIASKLFFLRKNDLVVDTEAMTLGTRRSGKVLRYFYEDNEITHFKYFENKNTNQAILTALKSEWGEIIPGFTEEPLSVPVANQRNIKAKLDGGRVNGVEKISGKKPVVILIPGIMGSNLSREDKVIWINYFKFITGGLKGLKINNKLKPDSLVASAYEKLVNDLEETYDVVTFPFDWRLSLEDSAALLDKKIREVMKFGQPVKLIGHSMGGVLIRDFMVLYKETWNKLNNSKDFQLIFLGAPLGGSYRIPAVLFGMDGLINKLALIDVVHTQEDLLEIFSRFRGILSLLPFDGGHDFSNPEVWKAMAEGKEKDDVDGKWPVPSGDDLKWFSEYRTKMKDAIVEEDVKNAVYIAGHDKATFKDYTIEDKHRGKELVFWSTGEGDFSVTWESGIPKIMKEKDSVYYVEVTHGELANKPEMFKGIRELLEKGETNLFSKQQPLVRGGEKLFKAPVFRDFDLSQAGVDFSILGVGGSSEPKMELPPLKVSISNGDLFYAKYPLLAGHFEEDGILSAEKEVDSNLDFALSHRYSLGIYPGRTGTNEVFLKKHSGFRGAVIVGLGKPENLTASELTKTVEQGTVKYLLTLNEELAGNHSSENNSGFTGISSLLIGAGYGGLSVENSALGIIQGIFNANLKVRNLNLKNTMQINHIEFVELFEDSALTALYSLGRIEKQESRSMRIVLEEKKIHTLLGNKKRIPNEISPEWWSRITVKKVENSDTDKTIRCLTFNASTSRAHEKEKELFSTPALLEGTIKAMSTNNRWTPQSAKSIFELLIPNDFKEQLKRHGNINWIVDYYTAEYPWELLQDEITDTRPLCVASGMIRQLATANYSQVIKTSPKNNVLIVADPDLKGFASQLPGALKEGQEVAAKIIARGMNTVTCFKGNSDEIIERLFCDDYRIIHLSGHGIFNEDLSKGSGMVIGKNMFLSTREIKQMSTAPELVFVNCCHIGKISGVAEELYEQRYKLAANIGTQLIENGVKCVIAAGWAVDDSAALEFANVFYESLLTGYTFGDSVTHARRSVFEKYGNTNTWGAYQCYGDPFYRLERRQDAEKKMTKLFFIAQEAEIELLNLLSELEIGKKTTEEYLKALETISDAVDRAKIRTPVITEKEAQIYLELKDYDKACEKYESLLHVEDASFSFSVAEKYFNAKAKKIAGEFRATITTTERKPGNKETELKRAESLVQIQKVIDDMEALTRLIPSAERLNILGSTYKRKAFILANDKAETFEKAALCYQQAYYFSNNWYSLTNWLAIECVLVLSEEHQWNSDQNKSGIKLGYQLPSNEEAIGMLDDSQVLLCDNNERMSYWDMLAGINIELCKYILQFSVKQDDKKEETGKKDFSTLVISLWKKAGSVGKRFAEIEHIEFIIDALTIKKNKNTTALSEKLSELKKNLEQDIDRYTFKKS